MAANSSCLSFSQYLAYLIGHPTQWIYYIGRIKYSNKINIHIYATNDLNNIIFGEVKACDPNPLTDPFRFSLTENVSINVDPIFRFEVYSPNKQNRTI